MKKQKKHEELNLHNKFGTTTRTGAIAITPMVIVGVALIAVFLLVWIATPVLHSVPYNVPANTTTAVQSAPDSHK